MLAEAVDDASLAASLELRAATVLGDRLKARDARRLNERLGYRPRETAITVRGPLVATE